MTDLSAEQNAMLEQLCHKHGLRRARYNSDGVNLGAMPMESALAFGRELLQAVQERDAEICETQIHRCLPHESSQRLMAAIIKNDILRQTYADLFPSTTTETEEP